MKSKILILIFGTAVIYFPKSFAQDNPPAVPAPTYINEDRPEPKTDWRNKFFFGGEIGLQFGSYTYIGAFPMVGYHITEKLSSGIGGTYIYLDDKPNHYSTSLYGGKVFSEYNVYKGIAPHIEYEILSEEIIDPYSYERKRIAVNSLLIGASYTQEIGNNAGLYIMLLYNVIEDIYSPYVNPILRIGFNIGI
jgi:hypothetical protein